MNIDFNSCTSSELSERLVTRLNVRIILRFIFYKRSRFKVNKAIRNKQGRRVNIESKKDRNRKDEKKILEKATIRNESEKKTNEARKFEKCHGVVYNHPSTPCAVSFSGGWKEGGGKSSFLPFPSLG